MYFMSVWVCSFKLFHVMSYLLCSSNKILAEACLVWLLLCNGWKFFHKKYNYRTYDKKSIIMIIILKSHWCNTAHNSIHYYMYSVRIIQAHESSYRRRKNWRVKQVEQLWLTTWLTIVVNYIVVHMYKHTTNHIL